ncbi:hypothetical protein GCM10010329_64120 [Streptomyces spiroverticillatus]|uniref:Uncharacterized protein n=1 Tax=Streptomyces finlayi TaxID=67296 RepID=A0A918X4D1_9ACTN|nr:hypothetical protein [Streptomyces finlayi]GHA31956.1 hypothetical protein GCM10010329_64120 [Streptomyces spiroverticillatus]GHD10812.1 hypothetical protein GCM10010334_66430 [Streptomyces finlayi]
MLPLTRLREPHLLPLWSLREDCVIRQSPAAPCDWRIDTPWGEARLGPIAPVVRRALERMTYGPVLLDNVLPGFTDGDVPTGQHVDHAALRAVLEKAGHAVVRTLAFPDGSRYVTVTPEWPRARLFSTGRPEPDAVHRLSRHVTLHDAADGRLLQAPSCAHRALLHTPRAERLIDCYAAPARLREVSALLGRPVPETALVVGLLEAAGLLVPVSGGAPPPERGTNA